MISEELRSALAGQALCSLGQGIPWKALLEKKHLTVGFMGGSVTQGYAQLQISQNAYPQMVVQGLAEQGYEAEGCLCAEAGMGTMNGNLLADEWVLARNPDLVILEFAINETTLKPSVISFESMLRKLLTAPDPPVVCIFILRSMHGYSCEPFMQPIAEHYGLPYLILDRALQPAIERGDLVWEDYADEESHPNADGHRLLADMLLDMLAQAKRAPQAGERLPLPAPWLEAPYTNLRYLHPAEDTPGVETNCEIIPRKHNDYYPAAWNICAAGGALKLTVRCRVLLVFYETHRFPEYGDCRISVDGVPLKEPLIRSNSLYGWGNAKFVTAVSSDTCGEHTLLLEPENQSVYILGFGICE